MVWFVFFKISVGLAAVVWMSDFALVKWLFSHFVRVFYLSEVV
jgi:hypothetical protein